MEKSLAELMTERHQKYQAALARHFEDEELTLAWREANRLYVLARDAGKRRLIHQNAA